MQTTDEKKMHAIEVEKAYRRGFTQGVWACMAAQRDGATDLQIDSWYRRLLKWRWPSFLRHTWIVDCGADWVYHGYDKDRMFTKAQCRSALPEWLHHSMAEKARKKQA